jgi:flagellar basal-body rod modification protein FlgD
MPIDSITGSVDQATQAAALAANAASKKSQTMDSEVFMKLLVTQLQNQDPSSPMDTNQMISQQTQLAMMEQITNQTTTGNENFSLQMRIAAANLVGKQVTYTDASSGASVNGKEVDLDVISGIKTA